MRLHLDTQSPIPIRWQLAEQLKHVIESGGGPRGQAVAGLRELAGFLGRKSHTMAPAAEDLKRGGQRGGRSGPIP